MTFPSVELSEVAELERRSLAPNDIKHGARYLGLEHIQSGGEILGSVDVEANELKSSKYQFSDEHVLYGKLRPYLAKIALPDFSGICSTDIIPIRPGPNLDRRYLAYLLRQEKMVEYANARASGANLPRLSPKQLAKLPIPLPPLAEQKRIAKILDAADALRARRRESLAQLDALLQSTFLKMFGDPVENPKGWEQVSISSTESQVQIGPFGSLLHKDDYVTNGTPLVNPKHIVDGRIAVSDKETVSPAKAQELGGYQLRPGDVVLGRRGEMGRAAVVRESDGAVLCGTGSMFVRPNDRKLHPEYLQNLLSCAPMREKLEQIASGVTMLNLNATKIKELVIPVPPIAHQEKYPGAQASISRQRDRYEAQAADLDNLFAALQHRAFAGQL